MKAEPAVQRQLLELAKVDAELARTAHRRRNLPELAEIDAGEKAVRAKRDALVAVETAASDLDREIARQDKEIESVRAREDRDRKLLESGTVVAKQMADIEHELHTLERRQAALEDDLLELMEQREALGLDAQRTGLNFVGSYDAYGINALFFENYWNTGAPAAQERDLDNIVVSMQRIGC